MSASSLSPENSTDNLPLLSDLNNSNSLPNDTSEYNLKKLSGALDQIKRNNAWFYLIRYVFSVNNFGMLFIDSGNEVGLIFTLILLPILCCASIWRTKNNFNEYFYLNNKHLNIYFKVGLNMLATIASLVSAVVSILLLSAITIPYITIVLPSFIAIAYGGKFFIKAYQACLWRWRSIYGAPDYIDGEESNRHSECMGRYNRYKLSAFYSLGVAVSAIFISLTNIIAPGVNTIIMAATVLFVGGLNTWSSTYDEFFKPKPNSAAREKNPKFYEDLPTKYPNVSDLVKVLTDWHQPGSAGGRFFKDDIEKSLQTIKKYHEQNGNPQSFKDSGKTFLSQLIQKKIDLLSTEIESAKFFVFQKTRDKKVFLEWLNAWLLADPEEKKNIILSIRDNKDKTHEISGIRGISDVMYYLKQKSNSEFAYNLFSSLLEGTGEVEGLLKCVNFYQETVKNELSKSASQQTLETQPSNDSLISENSLEFQPTPPAPAPTTLSSRVCEYSRAWRDTLFGANKASKLSIEKTGVDSSLTSRSAGNDSDSDESAALLQRKS